MFTGKVVLCSQRREKSRESAGEARAGHQEGCVASTKVKSFTREHIHETESRKIVESLSILPEASSTAANFRSLSGSISCTVQSRILRQKAKRKDARLTVH